MDLWANIGVNYQRLNDYKNAARSFLTSARNIRESYPADLNSIKRCIDAAVIDYVQYYQPIANKSSIKDEVHSFVVEYSFVGDLKGLYNLYCEFIYAEDDDALSAVEAFVIPKETDNDQILDFYIGVAEQSFHDELYQKSADYNMKAIIQSEISMQPMSAYFEYDGVKHSRWEYIAYCLTKVGDFEGAVNAYLNNVASVGRNLGSESVEYNQSMELLYHVASDEKMGPILDRILKEKGY
jgi:tetratricopeptide (TPR) repeat protein